MTQHILAFVPDNRGIRWRWGWSSSATDLIGWDNGLSPSPKKNLLFIICCSSSNDYSIIISNSNNICNSSNTTVDIVSLEVFVSLEDLNIPEVALKNTE